jgi:ribonuclease BN (tRNA processing enzyme)
MRVTVLGGSAAGGNDGAGGSGYLVETDQAAIVLDLGPGTLPELRTHTNYRTLDGIVISHLHVDHVLDLPALRYALSFNPIKPDRKIPLWMPPGGEAFLRDLGRALDIDGDGTAFFSTVFDVTEFDPAQPVTIADATISFAPTVHYLPCWAMRVSASPAGGDLFYSADTGPAADLTDLANDCAVAVIEATFIEPTKESFASRGHLTATEAGELAERAGVKTLVLTHLCEEFGFDNYRAGAGEVFEGRIELACPGLTVEW